MKNKDVEFFGQHIIRSNSFLPQKLNSLKL